MSSAATEVPAGDSASQPELQWEELRRSALETIRSAEIPDEIEVPALPQAVTEFMDESSSPDFDYGRLAQIVEKDPGLTCELLRYVNSAAVGLSSPVGSVRQALSHLGINTARTYLMAAGVKAATRSQQSRLLNARHFWNASLQRGLFARAVAACLNLDTGLCFMGGLLQDFLLPVLTDRFDAEYIVYLETEAREGRDLCDWEREVFGWDHAGAGACVAASWRFPDDLLCALFYHHELQATLQRPEMEFFSLFPVTCAALLPDQLMPSTRGIRELIRVDARCAAICLDELCRQVDAEQMQQAENYEIPHHLQNLVEEERRCMEHES